MQRREWRTIDKSGWPERGPWDSEPDKALWLDEKTGLPCMIVRGPSGALCGYVGVGPSHPAYGKSYSDEALDMDDIHAHGGLTFADGCHEATPASWEKIRARRVEWQEEARRHPLGDAAERLRDYADLFDDFAAYQRYAEARFVCHADPCKADPRWWFGFDCAHAWDICPKYDRQARWGTESSYRTLRYVELECAKLAKQLHAMQMGVTDGEEAQRMHRGTDPAT